MKYYRLSPGANPDFFAVNEPRQIPMEDEMARRITLAKEDIDSALNTVQFQLQQEFGVGTAEFTRLVLEVLNERSTDFIMKEEGTQIIFTNKSP